MDDERHEPPVRELARTADRLESLADTAELMGDEAGAARFRSGASQCRLQAMALLDGEDPPGPAGSAGPAGSVADEPAASEADERPNG